MISAALIHCDCGAEIPARQSTTCEGFRVLSGACPECSAFVVTHLANLNSRIRAVPEGVASEALTGVSPPATWRGGFATAAPFSGS